MRPESLHISACAIIVFRAGGEGDGTEDTAPGAGASIFGTARQASAGGYGIAVSLGIAGETRISLGRGASHARTKSHSGNGQAAADAGGSGDGIFPLHTAWRRGRVVPSAGGRLPAGLVRRGSDAGGTNQRNPSCEFRCDSIGAGEERHCGDSGGQAHRKWNGTFRADRFAAGTWENHFPAGFDPLCQYPWISCQCSGRASGTGRSSGGKTAVGCGTLHGCAQLVPQGAGHPAAGASHDASGAGAGRALRRSGTANGP